MGEVFKSDEAKERMLRWHERFREQLRIPTQSRMISTRFGDTHLLVGGSERGEKVVLLHGAMTSSAHAALELEPLLERFRVYSVDLLGQSPKGAEVRVSVEDNSYGEWLTDVLDALELPRAHIVGIGWGGFAALRLASHAPDRVERLALLTPAGIVGAPFWPGFKKVGWPLFVNRIFPSDRRLDEILKELLTTPDEAWTGHLRDAFLAYRQDIKVPKLAEEGELDGLSAPALVMAAEHDLSFPGPALLNRAAQIIPSLTDTALLSGCKHHPPTTAKFRRKLSRRIGNFFVLRDPRWSIPPE